MKYFLSIVKNRFPKSGAAEWSLGILVVVLTSCSKVIEVAPPIHEIGSAIVFNDAQTADAAITGMYSQMMTSSLTWANGALSTYSALSADELYPTSPSTTLDPFYTNSLSANDGTIRSRFWVKAYELIYHANANLEGLERSSQISGNQKDQLKGEALFCRALSYFYLVNLFGDVPLVLSTDFRVNATLPRMAVSQVYSQIVQDLETARASLPPDYVSANKTRPNSWTATALLARVFLYLEDWEKAEAAAANLIQSGHYQLETDLSQVFLAESKETIWQLFPVLSTSNSAEGNAFIPATATARPTYALTPFLLQAFDERDHRKQSWVKTNTVGGQLYDFPFKYKVRVGTVKSEYNVVLRLAEQVLIRAEARARMGLVSPALEDLNQIRNRAGLEDTLIAEQEALLAAIQEERRVELFAEWGHRWLDLKRTGMINAHMGAIKNDWMPYKKWYPIPQSELLLNPFLVQNPGY